MKPYVLIGVLFILSACNNSNLSKEKEEPKKETQSAPIQEVHYSAKQLELKTALEEYLKQLESLNTEGIIELTYPKLFVPINRELFIHYINTLLSSEEIQVDSFKTTLLSLGNVRTFNGGEYAQIEYQREIKLSFINPELYSDELSVRVLQDVLARKYGKENIFIDAANRTITIKETEKLLAIKEGEMGWKFIGDNPSYRKLYPRIIPADILSEI